MNRHSLLARQLKRSFGDDFKPPAEWAAFIAAVDDAYRQSDVDRTMLERSLDLSSQELLQANAELRAVFETIPDLLFRIDEAGLVSSVISGSEADYLLAGEKLRGRSLGNLATPELSELFSRAHRQALETHAIVNFDYSVTRGHRTLHFEARLAPRGPDDCVAIVRDLTIQRNLATKLQCAQRLDSIGKLAGGIAHDLNNILVPIMLGAAMLRPSLSDPDDQSMLETIEASARRGAKILRQILMFARGTEATKEPVQSRHLLREVATMLERTLPKTIAIRVNFPSELWLIEADATQIHQVFMNLCVNARDAMPAGGVLTLSGENVTVDAAAAAPHPGARPGSYVAWTIADTGEGIAPENLPHIFDPFFTTKDPSKGTGLGLHTVRELVLDHGGFINVSSTPGEGTCITVYLPATDSTEARLPEPRQLLPIGYGERVLLVDDEYSIRQMVAHVLNTHGYQVTAVDGGEAALTVFRENSPAISLLITDLMMPNMGGEELIRQLRSRNPQLKVITISGLADRAKQNSLAVDIMTDAFLQKPFTIEELVTLVDAVLREEYPAASIPQAGGRNADAVPQVTAM